MDKPNFKIDAPGPAGSEIANWIRDMIRSRRFVPGQRLVEVDIIRRTGGSRFKVREALQRLESEGLVEIEEFRGASVRNPSMEEVRQLYRARGALEGIGAADFTRYASAEEKSRLLEIATEMERCVEEGAPEKFGRLNASWHSLIMEGAGDLVIKGIVQRLNTPVHHLVFETFYRGERLRAAAADHSVVIDAIMQNDPEAAESAMRQHVENGLTFLKDLDSEIHFDEPLAQL